MPRPDKVQLCVIPCIIATVLKAPVDDFVPALRIYFFIVMPTLVLATLMLRNTIKTKADKTCFGPKAEAMRNAVANQAAGDRAVAAAVAALAAAQESPGSPSDSPSKPLKLKVPEGTSGGAVLNVKHNGLRYKLRVPEGLQPGSSFTADLGPHNEVESLAWGGGFGVKMSNPGAVAVAQQLLDGANAEAAVLAEVAAAAVVAAENCEDQTTVKEHDLAQIPIIPLMLQLVVMGCAHFAVGIARPLLMMPSMQTLMFLRNPMVKIHWYGHPAEGPLERPIKGLFESLTEEKTKAD